MHYYGLHVCTDFHACTHAQTYECTHTRTHVWRSLFAYICSQKSKTEMETVGSDGLSPYQVSNILL